MIYLGMPYGSNFGWGVLGKNVALAMAEMTDVRVIAPPGLDQRIADEFEAYRFRKLLLPTPAGDRWKLDGPVIQAAIGRSLEPFVPLVEPPYQVGFAVFEENILPKSVIEFARRTYVHLAAGSSYCAEVLREHGLTNVSTVLHGVDSEFFRPRAEPRTFLRDRFIVFSGGKFELRKGQDIVIRAYKVLQDRHPDVMLVNSWHNPWPQTRDTMRESKLIRYFPPKDDDHVRWMNALLAANGIDVERVITIGQRDHRLLPDLYHMTDLGLFPNRVEGGNNMVLMEYMACGKPVLASYNSGHKDIINRKNAILIENHQPMERRVNGERVAVWNDPSLEETIGKLEWCYQTCDGSSVLRCKSAVVGGTEPATSLH